ncbi:hypothetical protein [Thermostaphylospora chromogena]|uniref:Secreted protein n=1 Tax=Thermostaphylospora chromogena TaxID=35622 RepID=A0A1H1E6X9_9ACTN|nr:hypothetical protein [Thermostaphylospora chromogena]SDQ84552.1 hypothetical protein SAMN04489764_2345 [Thermostaphylospora chromogena]
MLKKFLVAGAVLAGVGLAAPAQADAGGPWPVNDNHYNISSIGDPVAVCGNSVINDLSVGISALLANPVMDADKHTVTCNISVTQK